MPTTLKMPPARKAAKRTATRMTLAETMSALEKAGSAQTRKTYARHGAVEPMFGVSFATLKTMLKRIGVDHELALALWDTGNFDARNLAVKIADPSRMSSSDLDRWASVPAARVLRRLRGVPRRRGTARTEQGRGLAHGARRGEALRRVDARRHDGDARRGHPRCVVRRASRGDREIDPRSAQRAAKVDAARPDRDRLPQREASQVRARRRQADREG